MHRIHVSTVLFVCLLIVPHFAFGQCSQTFTPSNVGINGSNVNTAVQNGSATTVLCFASGNYGSTIQIFAAHPSGRVTITPASGAAATGVGFNMNGVSNLTVTGFTGFSNMSGGVEIINAGQGDSSNLTVSNNNMGSSGISVRDNVMANANILIDGNTITAYATGGGYEPAIPIINTGTSNCPNGITVSHNHIIGGANGDAMGTLGDACGTRFVGNEIENIVEADCGATHCDGFQDNGGGRNTVLDGNYWHNVTNCVQATDGTTNLTVTNNVCVTTTENHSSQFSPTGMTFKHNTWLVGVQMGNNSGGQSASNVVFTDNVLASDPGVNGGQSITGTFTHDYNLCRSGCTGSHSLNGTPTFVGGSTANSYAGYALTSASRGHNAGDDGKDMGVNATGGSAPPATPPPTADRPAPPTNLQAIVQ